MKKWGYIICFAIIFIVAISTGVYMFKSSNKIENTIDNEIVNTTVIGKEEYSIVNDITIETATKQEKVSPNATLVLKKHYKECDHTIKEYAEIPEDFVNLNEEELQKQYTDWKIEKFSSLEVVLVKEEEGVCNEHYILKEADGVIVVYKIETSGEETLVEETGISIDYLTESDKMKIKEGIRVYGKEELNSTLEDYE